MQDRNFVRVTVVMSTRDIVPFLNSQHCTDDNVDFVMGKTGVICAGVRDTVTVCTCTYCRVLE